MQIVPIWTKIAETTVNYEQFPHHASIKRIFQEISSISYEVSYILGVLRQLTHAKHKNHNRIQKILVNVNNYC